MQSDFKILVTGAAGFIGSHLMEELNRRGFETWGLDCLLEDSYSSKIKKRNVDILINKNKDITFLIQDLKNIDSIVLPQGLTHIVHLAAMPGLMKSWTHSELYFDNNVKATINLLKKAVNLNITKFLYISTSSVYGRTALGDENSEISPFSPYGVSKYSGEQVLSAFAQNFPLNFSILRYFSIYGPRQRPDMAYSIFIDRIFRGEPIDIYGDGLQSRSNTYISDCVNGTIAALLKGQSEEIYNIAGGEEINLMDAIETVATILKKKPKINRLPTRPGDQKRTSGSWNKALQHFGYKPEMAFRQGIENQVEQYLIDNRNSTNER